MKTLISDTDGYQIIAEIREVQNPDGIVQLRFLTRWKNAKAPEAEQVKFEMLLTQSQRKRLKEIL